MGSLITINMVDTKSYFDALRIFRIIRILASNQLITKYVKIRLFRIFRILKGIFFLKIRKIRFCRIFKTLYNSDFQHIKNESSENSENSGYNILNF